MKIVNNFSGIPQFQGKIPKMTYKETKDFERKTFRIKTEEKPDDFLAKNKENVSRYVKTKFLYKNNEYAQKFTEILDNLETNISKNNKSKKDLDKLSFQF